VARSIARDNIPHTSEVIMSDHVTTSKFEIPGARAVREGARELTARIAAADALRPS
jgi:hypothetical protein